MLALAGSAHAVIVQYSWMPRSTTPNYGLFAKIVSSCDVAPGASKPAACVAIESLDDFGAYPSRRARAAPNPTRLTHPSPADYDTCKDWTGSTYNPPCAALDAAFKACAWRWALGVCCALCVSPLSPLPEVADAKDGCGEKITDSEVCVNAVKNAVEKAFECAFGVVCVEVMQGWVAYPPTPLQTSPSTSLRPPSSS